MILLDASIAVDYWRAPDETTRRVMETETVYVAGVTCAELMHGAKSPADLDRIESILAGFSPLPTDEAVWPQVGRNLYALRRAGLTVPFQDVLLATLAVRHGLEVWATDAHFRMMRKVLRELKLFEPGAT